MSIRNKKYSSYYIFEFKPVGSRLYFFGNKPDGKKVKHRKVYRGMWTTGCFFKGNFSIVDYMVPRCLDRSRIMRKHSGMLKDALNDNIAMMSSMHEIQEWRNQKWA